MTCRWDEVEAVKGGVRGRARQRTCILHRFTVCNRPLKAADTGQRRRRKVWTRLTRLPFFPALLPSYPRLLASLRSQANWIIGSSFQVLLVCSNQFLCFWRPCRVLLGKSMERFGTYMRINNHDDVTSRSETRFSLCILMLAVAACCHRTPKHAPSALSSNCSPSRDSCSHVSGLGSKVERGVGMHLNSNASGIL